MSEGAFTIGVCGAGRTAMAASGRFLHLLAGGERERLAGLYAGLPVVTRGALAAQLSFPPRHPRAENVTRVPRMLPYLLSLGEYHGQDDPARFPLDDVAVTASADQFYLFSLSRRVPVEPVIACAPAWHAVPARRTAAVRAAPRALRARGSVRLGRRRQLAVPAPAPPGPGCPGRGPLAHPGQRPSRPAGQPSGSGYRWAASPAW